MSPDAKVDGAAFEELAERYRPEMRVHCYRMLGSFEDSEDAVQETLLRAWRRRETFQGRSTFRAWLYRIATNACLDAIGRRERRLQVAKGHEVPWLQPFPDQEEQALLERYLNATEEADAEAFVEMMREDAASRYRRSRASGSGGARSSTPGTRRSTPRSSAACAAW
jgi:RNA polymerase sigma factor (sigma-70 family)